MEHKQCVKEIFIDDNLSIKLFYSLSDQHASGIFFRPKANDKEKAGVK
jgi:hypothetical protein